MWSSQISLTRQTPLPCSNPCLDCRPCYCVLTPVNQAKPWIIVSQIEWSWELSAHLLWSDIIIQALSLRLGCFTETERVTKWPCLFYFSWLRSQPVLTVMVRWYFKSCIEKLLWFNLFVMVFIVSNITCLKHIKEPFCSLVSSQFTLVILK